MLILFFYREEHEGREEDRVHFFSSILWSKNRSKKGTTKFAEYTKAIAS